MIIMKILEDGAADDLIKAINYYFHDKRGGGSNLLYQLDGAQRRAEDYYLWTVG